MPDTLGTALIAAFATITGATVSAVVPKILGRSDEAKRYYVSSTLADLDGVWAGPGVDTFVDNGTPPIPFELRLSLTSNGNKLLGKGELVGIRTSLSFDGGLFSDRYLQLAYKSVDPGRMQMGVIVLHLLPDGNTLKGHYAGFSPIRETFVMGDVFLERVMAAG